MKPEEEEVPAPGEPAAPEVSRFPVYLLIVVLYVALYMMIAKRTEKPIRFVCPGCDRPCMPPETGYWPDCHAPGSTKRKQ